MRPTDRFENWFITSLQTGINDTTGSFRLNDNLNVSQARLVIDPYDESIREVVKVTSVDGNLVYVERGDDNTPASYHLKGAVVALNVVAADMNDLYEDFAGVVQATEDANQAASDAAQAAIDANQATTDANNAAGAATTATGNANLATSAANSAAGSANSAASSANTAAGNAQDAADNAQGIVDDVEATAFLASHPVGSTYWNETDSRNPGTVWGGTWVALEGVVLGGISDVSGSPFNVAAGTVIGEDEHQLTEGEMPGHSHTGSTNSTGSHSHGIPTRAGGINASYTHIQRGVQSGTSNSTESTNSGGSHSHTVTTDTTGGDAPHNNIQRTLVGYLWKRTA